MSIYMPLHSSTHIYAHLRHFFVPLCSFTLLYGPSQPLSAPLYSSTVLYKPLYTSMLPYIPVRTSMPLSGHLGPSAAPLCPFKGLFCSSLLFYISLWPNTLLYIPLGHFITPLCIITSLLAPIDSSMALYAPLCSSAFLYTHLHAS